ncbi:hypothetical protein EDF46_0316 [Frondihabitans sp. PhB188]|uniref:hypothetical protein n=1 Tax=Frondihabitans sp. PhB188 TaxID=2485200 RepID=UPI000FB55F48|nr:hypothetical protein [Frondihabitans sp. PhB188]ROQ40950.1 hypothetical protein EDF46_0316 [Frondihabitans sp. PhB188]
MPSRLAELDAENPVVRLDVLRSSIGSLLVDGVETAVWESVTGVSGSETPAGDVVGTVVATSGNRPLVGFDGRLAVVTLRHVRELRRALFVGAPAGSLGVRLFDGTTITATGDGPGPVVVLVLVIDGLVEIRVATAAASPEVHAEFGFELTRRFDFHSGNG